MTHSDGCVLKWFESEEEKPILKQIKVSKGLKEDFDFFFKLLTVLGHIYPPSKYIYAMYTTSIVPLEAEKMHFLIVCCSALKEEIQLCMTFTDMRLTEFMGITEKSATTKLFI